MVPLLDRHELEVRSSWLWETYLYPADSISPPVWVVHYEGNRFVLIALLTSSCPPLVDAMNCMSMCIWAERSSDERVAILALLSHSGSPATCLRGQSQAAQRRLCIMKGTGMHLAKRGSDNITSSCFVVINLGASSVFTTCYDWFAWWNGAYCCFNSLYMPNTILAGLR